MFWSKPSLKKLLPPPVKAAHAEYSMILSAHDDSSPPTPSLLQLSLKAIEAASGIDLDDLSSRINPPPFYPSIWPGEHYKLLAGLVLALKPRVVVEIGTATGLSALALKKFLPLGGKLATFDLASWRQNPKTVLREEDFADGALVQYVADLSDPKEASSRLDLLQSADLIFIDATHDGCLERILLRFFRTIPFTHPVYFCFDDIRVWTMLGMWREISLPKIDLTSFGHWSGTGLVELR